jgi:DNA-binding response OmpR family regulator
VTSAPGDRTILRDVSVLVCDDDTALCWALARLLDRAGARVRSSNGGDHAIALAAAAPVDLLVTDMEMPGCDGRDVALAVANLCPDVAIVFMSGRPYADHVANGRLVDGDWFVGKPFPPAVLVQTVAGALAGPRWRPRSG